MCSLSCADSSHHRHHHNQEEHQHHQQLLFAAVCCGVVAVMGCERVYSCCRHCSGRVTKRESEGRHAAVTAALPGWWSTG